MRIVHMLAPGLVGGLERVVVALAAGQREAGHDVRVLAVLDAGTADTPFLAALRRSEVPVTCIALPPRAYRLERSRLADVLTALPPDIAHSHGYRGDIQGGSVARRLGLVTVTTVHGFTGGGWKNRLYEGLQRRAFRRFDAVVAVASPLAARLRASGVPADRLHVIPNAAALGPPALDRAAARLELGLAPDAFIVGWVGRISHEKGLDVLVEALARTPGRVEAVVLGTGPFARTAEQLARSRGVHSRIHWAGLVADAGRLFAAFDCYVLSSRTEGTPIVLFEAMAAGVPIVAAAVGGVPDVVSGREAALVPPEDPVALADAIGRVRAEPEAARARAAAARQRLADERSVEPWVARYDTVYRQTLDSVRSRRPA